MGEVVPQDLMTQPFSMVGGGSVGSNIVKFEKENGFPIKVFFLSLNIFLFPFLSQT